LESEGELVHSSREDRNRSLRLLYSNTKRKEDDDEIRKPQRTGESTHSRIFNLDPLIHSTYIRLCSPWVCKGLEKANLALGIITQEPHSNHNIIWNMRRILKLGWLLYYFLSAQSCGA
jgi:hypothetical protein